MADTLPLELTQRQAPARGDHVLEVLASTGESPPADPNAWERIVGAFGQDPDLAEWWACGHALREAERSPE